MHALFIHIQQLLPAIQEHWNAIFLYSDLSRGHHRSMVTTAIQLRTRPSPDAGALKRPAPLPPTAQIATHPHNGDVFERLLLHRRGGTQLAMVPAAAYGFGRGGGWATFGLVAEEVMQSGRALALGYRRADGRMLLAPAPDDLVRWSEGDELVVMADTEG
jgi:hypothetical protein